MELLEEIRTEGPQESFAHGDYLSKIGHLDGRMRMSGFILTQKFAPCHTQKGNSETHRAYGFEMGPHCTALLPASSQLGAFDPEECKGWLNPFKQIVFP